MRQDAAAAAAAAAAAERAAREAYGKLLARIARRTRDIAAAEDALADAFARALARWPRTGVPDAPEAWLTTVALNRMRDEARHSRTRDEARDTIALLHEEPGAVTTDDRLGLILAASHPAISGTVHAPLILQTVFGVSAAEMALVFLVPASTIGQRLVRAKAKIKAAGIPFDADPARLPERLTRALDALYALYTMASAAPSPEGGARLAVDALHLSRLIARLAPDDPEALGLAALVAFAEARRPARRDAAGDYVPCRARTPPRGTPA